MNESSGGNRKDGAMSDREAIGWLRREFDHTLDTARQRLNAFAEAPQRRELLADFCRDIHQAAGALAMIRLEGGRVLAEHVEALAEAVAAGRRPADAEHLEPLMRASLELSDYFDRLAAGLPDAAAGLLPTTNEIRALLDEAPLERERLGRPLPATHAAPADLSGLAAQLRPRYQAALLAYYRGAQPRPALARMTGIVGELERAATDPAVFNFLWVVGGVLEALADGGLGPTLGIKRLLGHVERELKRLEKTSEEALAANLAQGLLDELLAQVGRARSRGERVTAIRGNFRLAEEVAQDESEATATGGSALMRSVGSAILEDLERVRDRIDLFVRTGRKDPEALAPLGGVLKKVADALGMLGLSEAQVRVERERESVLALAHGIGGDEPGLLRLATELIGIESEVETFLLGSGGDPHSAAARAARGAGLRETLAEVARIKDTVTEHLRYGGRPQALAGLPARADRLARVLDFLELTEAASLMRRIACYLERTPTLAAESGGGVLDHLADAVVSVEYYLETLQSGREPRAPMLENADRALEALGVGRDEGTVEAREVHRHRAPAAVAPPPSAPEGPRELASIRGVTEESAIADVFIEEAGEVCETLSAAYPRWHANPADRETLATLQRSFHTLKGSGRMAGALRLSEFARTFEELLNRMLELALPADRDAVELVGEAIAALPPLLEEFATGAESSVDTAGLMARASGLARAEEPAAEAPAVPAEETVEEEAATEASGAPSVPGEGEAPPAAPVPRLPATLYDIYSSETLDHLAVVTDWLEALERVEGTAVTPALRRAVHTLVGSARMATAEEMNAVMSPLEEALDRAAASECDPRELLEPVREAALVAARLLEAYGNETIPLPEWEPVRDRLYALRDSLPVAAPEAGVAEAPFEETEELEPVEEPSSSGAPEQTPSPAGAVFDLPAQASYDAELVQLFAGEAAELLEGADTALRAWLAEPTIIEPLSDILRRLHTLKGGARMAGIAPFADLVHDLESLLTRVAEGDIVATGDNRELAERAFDRLHRMLEHVTGDGRVPLARDLLDEIALAMEARAAEPPRMEETERPEEVEEVLETPGAGEPATGPAEEGESERAPIEEEVATEDESLEAIETAEAPADIEVPPQAPALPAEDAARRAEQVRQRYRRMGLARVRADLLEAAINGAGEVGIYRGRLEQQIVNMNLHLAELERTVDRVRNQLRELEIETEAQMLSSHDLASVEHLAEFDPLEFDRYTHIQELSRSLAEAVSDLLSLRGLFAGELRQAEASLERQGRINAELQDALLRTRMMPFALSEARLRRVIRQVAEESGKQAELTLVGMEGEMDRQVLEHVLPALEHVLRNAVVHGIEDADLRRTRGKPEAGRIELALRREGAETLIEVADDGGGLDFAAIRARAAEEGLIAPDAEPSEHELTEFIFRSGFSTAGTLSQAAGRGVGMDVVATEVRHTGGNVEVRSQTGRGMRVTLRLPSGLAISHALIVRVGAKRYPVPLASVEGIARVSRAELDQLLASERPAFQFGGRNYELASLHEALGEEPVPADEEAPRLPLLMARAGARRAAFIADDMEGSREVVVKPVGPQVGRIPGISGATIFGDGTIALLLDLPGLVRAMPEIEARIEAARAEAASAGAEPLVMVVDDSITVRRVTERMLARHNVRVMTAKDGLEALELLGDHTPNLMLLDIEMPRMDGYELAERMKADTRLKRVPIIVITSRAGEKHRARAAAIGIERYLGKPYQESELLAAIRSVMEEFDAPAFHAGQ